MSSRHSIQFHATGKAKSGNNELACSVHYSLICAGNTMPEARKNGLPEAKILASEKLLEEVQKRHPDATIIEKSIVVS